MTILTEASQIERARLLTLRSALKLEIKGMTRKGRSACSLLKDMGFKGRTKQQVLESVEEYINGRT